ncbi:MAG: DUF6455 family protein [Rhodobacteraceae bacterium]|nr:DUF6455 family protein [Paracoccaceae bacterium]
MRGGGKIDRHMGLVKRMAATVGADLAGAVADGRLAPADLRGAVLKCTGCACPDACGRWLEEHAAGAEAAPGYCRNADLFARLALPGGD